MEKLKNFFKILWELVTEYFATQHEVVPDTPSEPQNEPESPVIPPEPIVAPIPPKYLWDTKENVRHSIRVICDEEGLSVEDKNTLCATIQCESNFNTQAINENKINGKVVSTDYGLCQWNDYYHGAEISPDESLNNPEKAVRLMCQYWKRGEVSKGLWICYRKGMHRQYL